MPDPGVVVITGASAGVGRATVRAFAERGWDIGLLARGTDGLQAAAKEVEAAGGRAVAVPTDVADPDQVEAAAVLIEELLGPINVWVNNAMTSVFALFTDIAPDEFRRVTDVTYCRTPTSGSSRLAPWPSCVTPAWDTPSTTCSPPADPLLQRKVGSAGRNRLAGSPGW